MQETIQAAEDRLKEWEENRVAEIASISRKLGKIEGIDFDAEEIVTDPFINNSHADRA